MLFSITVLVIVPSWILSVLVEKIWRKCCVQQSYYVLITALVVVGRNKVEEKPVQNTIVEGYTEWTDVLSCWVAGQAPHTLHYCRVVQRAIVYSEQFSLVQCSDSKSSKTAPNYVIQEDHI